MTDIEQIKQKINIVDFINEYVPLKKMGRNFRANCPFHSEKTPSFYVSAERQVWHCFGCQKGGDVFTFLMEIERIEFVEALRDLAERTGVKLRESYELTGEQKHKEQLYGLHQLAAEYYHYILTQHQAGERARECLKKRGIKEETIKTFLLGYAPDSWEATGKYLLKKGFRYDELVEAGLAIKGRGYYDRFRGRLIFPIRDHRGQTIAFGGRILSDRAETAKYINSPETPIYTKGNTLYGIHITKEAIRSKNTAILVEGEFDLLSSFQDGVSNVVAIKGSALTEGQIQLLKRFTDKLIFALDSDLAGDQAARRGIEIADAANFLLKVVVLPQGKDPDECVKMGGGLWKKAVEEAIPIYDYFISSAQKRFDIGTIEGKKRLSDELIPILSKIENTIIKAHYTRKLAGILAIPEATVALEMEKSLRKQQIQRIVDEPAVQPTHSREEQLEEYILAVLFQVEDLTVVKEFIDKLSDGDFRQSAMAKIFIWVKAISPQLRVLPLYQSISTLPKELISTLDRLILVDVTAFMEEKYKRSYLLLKEFELHALRRKMREITTKIRLLTEEGQEKQLQIFTEELQLLTKRIKELESPAS